MTNDSEQNYRQLRAEEIRQLTDRGCTALDWSAVRVADPLVPERFADVEFVGQVRLGALLGDVQVEGGRAKPAGIYRARIEDCTVGNGVRIANVGSHLSGYQIGNHALIENVGVMETRKGARFGNGVEAEVLNEAGGREVPLFNALSSQYAYLVCLHRYREGLVDRLLEIGRRAANEAARDFGQVGEGAYVVGVPKIQDVNIGPAARIDSAQSLVNGTVLSHPLAVTTVGDGVMAKDFIVAEGTQVTGGAMLSKTFVGQGCRVGKQFSAENSLFFANGEGFHGEACSVFAGPYTVTHHKSTLLIGGLFSFYNAGSGTNQSNHRYKLGPTHEGKLERGCKTGSFSYVMWPARVGPFSVVLGKHTRSFNTEALPFSHLEADEAGRCELIPGHYIATVGTLRDGLKWPQRDRRTGPALRDILCFDVFSPLTVGRMVRGAAWLDELHKGVDRTVATVNAGGATIKRVLLRTGVKRYTAAVERYLLEQIFLRLERRLAGVGGSLRHLFSADAAAVDSTDWIDLGGQLMPRERWENLSNAVVAGSIETIDQLQRALLQIREFYEEDTWLWVRRQSQESLGFDLDCLTIEQVQGFVARYCEQQQKFLRLVLLDAEHEYDEGSRIGFGVDGAANDRDRDFVAVRGAFQKNSFVRQVTAELESLPARCDAVREQLAAIA
ncbi:MAG: DUF4954 family protein [Planctomycetes bacterium]|nr:DUF4954 family protein [Planctomycetota bacterium]